METRQRRWWPVVKALLSLVILGAVGWRFAIDLARPELYQRPVQVGWLFVAGILYLAGISLSALYWRRLLVHLGYPIPVAIAMRAWFVSTLGKYVPGKAWSVLLRVGLVRPLGVGPTMASVTTFYEVITTMASGALLSLILILSFPPAEAGAPWLENLRDLVSMRQEVRFGRDALALAALALTAITLGPVVPPIFNVLVHRISLPFRKGAAPVMRWGWLLEGLLLIMPGWVLLGLSLRCVFLAIPGADPGNDLGTLAHLTAAMGVAYVAGFVMFLTPGGLGVREFVLTVLLAPDLARSQGEELLGVVTLAVLLLRLVWTVSELLVAGSLYLWAPVKIEAMPEDTR